ncbi:DUF4097 family beta strand repeat-containing protein [Streptomyces fradiae]|uniref:DUF4097 family beta strand repeat-containing protein n=1 Tax=Streptomyces fradiae TaxID=1906 RepID=UPI003792C44A
MPEWSVTEPMKLTLDDPVTALRVRVVNGAVNVVGTDGGPARLEVAEVRGPALTVTQDGETLTVGYPDLSRQGGLLDRLLARLPQLSKADARSAVVSLAVPAGASVEIEAVGAGAVVSGVRGRTKVSGVGGDMTLVGLSGPVRAQTVSGGVEAQSVTGDLRFQSVSGDLTVVEGSGASVRADSVSGDVLVDVDPEGEATDIQVATVTGEVAIRLPHRADARVEASTTSGSVASAFDGLRVDGAWGAKRISGTLGAGTGTLKATTMSGAIALLRRPEPSGPGGSGAGTSDDLPSSGKAL